MKKTLRFLVCLSLAFLFIACGGGGGGGDADTEEYTEEVIQNPPVADAGADLSAYRQDTVYLIGSGSSDPDGDPLTCLWEFVSFPAASSVGSLTGSNTLVASFIPDVLGTYNVRLTVSDGELTAKDDVTILVLNRYPIALAGDDSSVYLEDGWVVLNGAGSTDPDGDQLSYHWSFDTLPATSGLSSLAGSTSLSASFLPDVPGNFIVRLTVVDGFDAASDTVLVNVAGPAPVPAADAGGDLEVTPGSGIVALDGSASTDPEGLDLVSYTWTQVLGTDVTGGSRTLSGISPEFTAPEEPAYLVFSLVVSNGYNESPPDTVMVRIAPDPGYGFIFVDPVSGDDANPGSLQEPLATLAGAMAAAAAASGADVFVASGVYTERLTVPDATRVLGGYNPATWEREFLSPTIIVSSDGTGAYLAGLANGALLDGLDIRALVASGPGRSSYGVRIVSSNDVNLKNCTVQAGDGTDGTDGLPGSAGFTGQPGGNAPYASPNPGTGGTGVYAGGNGGAGVSNSKGNDGSPGQPGISSGGTGGIGGNVSAPGGNGGDGGDGPDGNDGIGGDNFGSTAGSVYVGQSGSLGQNGSAGYGGGGGGAGGGYLFNFYVNGYPASAALPGGGGGGGGAGGSGGSGGTPGIGGGGSFGIFAVNSSAVVVSNCAVIVGDGGAGGDGGPGGTGGIGGTGGSGTTFRTTVYVYTVSTTTGGSGGHGGTGGTGGTGGGGGGGPSIGIFHNTGTSITTTGNTILVGQGGTGGSASIPAIAGSTGLTAPTYTW